VGRLDQPYAPPAEAATWPVNDRAAGEIREAALARAAARLADPASPVLDLEVREAPLTCRFVPRQPSGTSPKFDCALANGEIVKVKYGRNPEIAAEVAATRLIAALGYAADRMTIAESVRCDGCPRQPFLAMRLLTATGTYRLFPAEGVRRGYSDFAWVAVERKFDAAPIETPDTRGWAWFELDRVNPAAGAGRDELDALRLVAVFLAHWDNKSENQRLVCLDAPGEDGVPCARPLLMLQDLGATFGPTKADLDRWAGTPVWSDARACAVSMKAMPFNGGTFPDARISENARAHVARQLTAIPDDQVSALFRAARFPEHIDGTGDPSSVAAWQAAFRSRVQQITAAGPCPQ
jgi:hypothetical protein